MDAQEALAAGLLADLKAQSDAKSTIPAPIFGTLSDDVVEKTFRNVLISKELKLEMSTLEVVFGIFPRGKAMAMIAENAYVPAGNFDQNRKIIELIKEERAVGEDGKPTPSLAVSAINRALQQSRTGQVSVNWDMVVRSLLGLYVAVG